MPEWERLETRGAEVTQMCSPSPQEAVGWGGLSEVTYSQSLCQESRGKGRTTGVKVWDGEQARGGKSQYSWPFFLSLSHALTLCSESA